MGSDVHGGRRSAEMLELCLSIVSSERTELTQRGVGFHQAVDQLASGSHTSSLQDLEKQMCVAFIAPF